MIVTRGLGRPARGAIVAAGLGLSATLAPLGPPGAGTATVSTPTATTRIGAPMTVATIASPTAATSTGAPSVTLSIDTATVTLTADAPTAEVSVI